MGIAPNVPPEPDRLAQIRAQYPGVMEHLDAGLAEYIERSWLRGITDGIQLAIRMGERLLLQKALSDEQRLVLAGFVDALKDTRVSPPKKPW